MKQWQPYRALWNNFPDVFILKDESIVKQNPEYAASKSGDAESAASMLKFMLTPTDIAQIQQFIENNSCGAEPRLAAVHAYEANLNAIPAAMARTIKERTGYKYTEAIWQSNIVNHTGADGFSRLARQALFVGKIRTGDTYILVDDFVGQGGTLANLRGYIRRHGGYVAAALVLSGKPFSAKINPTHEQIRQLRKTHGRVLEKWWQNQFGHSFDYLTQSEARYLTRSPNADRIRERIDEAKCL